jgi:hypothetical protein
MRQDCIHKSAAPLTGTGMDDHTRRLVYDDNVSILIEDFKRQRLRFDRDRLRRRHQHDDSIAILHKVRGLHRRLIDSDSTLRNEALHGRSREGRQLTGYVPVHPPPSFSNYKLVPEIDVNHRYPSLRSSPAKTVADDTAKI